MTTPAVDRQALGLRLAWFRVQRRTDLLILYSLIIALIVTAVIYSPTFRTSHNAFNVLRQSVLLGTVSIGQTFIIISAGIDLSVGSMVKLTSLLAAVIMDGRDEMTLPAIAATLGVGLTLGLANALLVTRARVPPFIATLGTFTIVRGLALTLSTKPIGRASNFVLGLYGNTLGPVPYVVFLAALLWIGGLFVLRRTALGRHIYAVGGNERVAELSGIAINRVKMVAYCLSGFLASIGGLVALSRIGIGDPVVGEGLELDSITAVVLGGTSLFGGRGTLIGTLGGVFLLGLINNIFNVAQVSQWYQQLIKGLIIVGAVALYKQRS